MYVQFAAQTWSLKRAEKETTWYYTNEQDETEWRKDEKVCEYCRDGIVTI